VNFGISTKTKKTEKRRTTTLKWPVVKNARIVNMPDFFPFSREKLSIFEALASYNFDTLITRNQGFCEHTRTYGFKVLITRKLLVTAHVNRSHGDHRKPKVMQK